MENVNRQFENELDITLQELSPRIDKMKERFINYKDKRKYKSKQEKIATVYWKINNFDKLLLSNQSAPPITLIRLFPDLMKLIAEIEQLEDEIEGIKKPIKRVGAKTKNNNILFFNRDIAHTRTVTKAELMENNAERVGSFAEDLLIDNVIKELLNEGIKPIVNDDLAYATFILTTEELKKRALDGATGTSISIWHHYDYLIKKAKLLDPQKQLIKLTKNGKTQVITARPYDINEVERIDGETPFIKVELSFLKDLYLSAGGKSVLREPAKMALKLHEAYAEVYGDKEKIDDRIIESFTNTAYYILTHIHEGKEETIKTIIDLEDYTQCCVYDNWDIRRNNFKYNAKKSLQVLNKACSVFNHLGKTGRLEGKNTSRKRAGRSTCPIGVEKATYNPATRKVELIIRRAYIKDRIADYIPIKQEYLLDTNKSN